MKYKGNKEKVIIVVACTITGIIVLGFTLMQGTTKSKKDKYISKQNNIKSQL